MNSPITWRKHALPLPLSLLLTAALAACAGNDVRDATPSTVETPVAAAEPVTSPRSGVALAGQGPVTAETQPAADKAPPATDTATLPPADRAASTPATAQDTPTQAEQDYAALYGGSPADRDAPYDPVADSTLPTPVEQTSSYDPWEPLNRRVHAFNNVVDRAVAKPLAKAYVAVVPRPVRLGVGNFFDNLGQPMSAVNALLQGRPKQAGHSLARFAVNSTIGLVGIFDPATRFSIPHHREDFGQTLGVWGWETSRYVELPLFGPRTVRDVFGLVGDVPLAPVQYVEEDKVRWFLQGLRLVDVRSQLMAVDSMREGAADEYALLRDAWMQRRNYQIFSDDGSDEATGEQLPDYLREDLGNPTVPVDVMPMVPGSPGG